MRIDDRLVKIMLTGNAAQRRYICNRDDGFIYYCLYYFPEYFPYQMADFHSDMHEDLVALLNGVIQYLIWKMFRESAKTTLTRIFVTYCISFNKKKYINWDSYDKANSESALYMVALALQTNKKIIADFGQLYYIDKKKQRGSKIQRLGNFITANGVKCEAFSTQESTRGRIFNENRPDLFVLDDFETNKTKRSVATIASIVSHIDELLSGLNAQASVLFLCNYITESGVVNYLMEKAAQDKRFLERTVNIETDEGEPAWPARHVMTDDEADAVNAGIPDREHQVESLESKKRTLTDRVYGPEYLNKPEAAGDITFDREKVDAAIVKAKDRMKKYPPENSGGFVRYAKYQPHHRYAIGADTSKGVGRDSNASVAIDFTPIPAQVVSTYANKWIAPDVFADELKRQGLFFGECLLIPELNNTGYATITKLKTIYDMGKIYRQRQTGKNVRAGDKQPIILGFDTNQATRSTIIYEFKTAFEDGHLEIFDLDLLGEMRVFNQADFENIGKHSDQSVNDNIGITRHFDRMIGASLAWHGRDLAEVSAASRTQYQQAPIEASEYEGAPVSGATTIRPNYISDGFNKVIKSESPDVQAPYEPGEYEA